MKKAIGGRSSGGSGPRIRPRFTLAALGLLVVGVTLAGFELRREQEAARQAIDERLHGLARVAAALTAADDARIHALLARLRIELRTRGDWSQPAALGAGSDGSLRPARSIDNLLRRALEGTPELQAFELVVAGQDGLALARVEPGAGPPATLASAEREGRARSLWYADEVREAIAAQGRRVARSGLERESEAAAPAPTMTRVAIALHEGDEVVQGVLVAHLDLTPLGTRLASLSDSAQRFALLSPDGRVLGESPAQGVGDAAVPASEASGAILEIDGRRSLLEPAPVEGEEAPRLHFWVEASAPPGLAQALASGGWAVAILALLALVGAGWSRDRADRRVATATFSSARADAKRAGPTLEDAATQAAIGTMADATTPPAALGNALDGESANPLAIEAAARVASESDGAAGVSAPEAKPAADVPSALAVPTAPMDEIRPERFVLRDWLADVRGCLEREAASRGLTLVLRCDRALPNEIELDPSWLGGLLIALGREALDATRATRVALDVYATPASELRFELDAGDTAFDAAPGVRAAVARLGATLVRAGQGRLAVEVPNAIG